MDARAPLTACLNGARLPREHRALPVTPADLAREAAAAVAAGADDLHLHAKDAQGRDVLDAGPLAAALDAVRAAVPGVRVGVTTGAWAASDPRARVAAVRSWTVLPDAASVNWHERGADVVAGALLERGVGVEAGLWDEAAVSTWAASAHRDRCARVLVELPGGVDPARTRAEADALLARVAATAVGATAVGATAVGATAAGATAAVTGTGVASAALPVQLHGEATSTWTLLRHAGRLGLGARIGLEDVLHLPDGTRAAGNGALVAAAAVELLRGGA